MSGSSQSTAMMGFDDWWCARGETVEPANIRRDGESGVERIHSTEHGVLYVKRQRNHLFRNLRYPLGLPTVMREKLATEVLNNLGIRTPEIVFVEAKKEGGEWRAVLVTKELPGYVDLIAWYQSGGRERLGEMAHQQLLKNIGAVLGRMHKRQWQHTCLYPKHIFLTAGTASVLPDIALLDLESTRRKWFPGHAARRDLEQLYRHSRTFWNDQDWQTMLVGHRSTN